MRETIRPASAANGANVTLPTNAVFLNSATLTGAQTVSYASFRVKVHNEG